MKTGFVSKQAFVRPKTRNIAHNRTMLRGLLTVKILCIFFFFTSCASSRNFTEIDTSAQQGDFSVAREQLEEKKGSLYLGTDQVLYALDAGMLSRYADAYEQSNIELTQAELLIEKYFAVSVTQAIGSYLLNDNVIDYAGEDYEDIYINLFMALNYIQLGDTESAFVEIRRFDNKLKLISAKYSEALLDAKRQATAEGAENSLDFSDYAGSGTSSNGELSVLEFHNSALARYVSLLLYRSRGEMDSAEIDKKFIQSAFQTQKQLYPFPIPNAIEEEFSIPEDKERLNIFCYAGLAPEKYEETLRVPGIVSDTWFKVALPVMAKRSSAVSSISITAIGEQGQEENGTLELFESVENIVVDTFQQRQSLIYLKSVLRSIAKSTTSGVGSAVVEEIAGGLAGSLFSLASNIFIEASEQADLRTSRYFPAQVWVGGLNLDSGTYAVTITCFDAWNNVLYKETKQNVQVTDEMVNLVEAVCIQ